MIGYFFIVENSGRLSDLDLEATELPGEVFSIILFIHRNTKNYRMRKIPELFGLGLDNIKIRERCMDPFSLFMKKESLSLNP